MQTGLLYRDISLPAGAFRPWPTARLVRSLLVLLVLIGHLGLSFNVLSAGLAVGAEAHHHPPPTPGDDDAGAHDDQGCDHGCHATAHLQGVVADPSPPTLTPRILPREGHQSIWCSHTPSLPPRPPRHSS